MRLITTLALTCAALTASVAIAAETKPPPMGGSILMWSPQQQEDGYKAQR